MSIDLTRRNLNQLEKNIAELEKKSAEYANKEAKARSNISRVRRGITKNTSESMLRSKNRQIQQYNNEAIKAISSKADIDKKIADKRKRRNDTNIKLQKEEAIELKRVAREQQNIQRIYESQIDSLTAQIENTTEETMKENHIYANYDDVEYDVFISHATEDKESFADSLYGALKEIGFKVWYDVQAIEWGDSLRKKIDEGLHKSKFGIVILSNNYIRKGWTQYELDGLFQREMTQGKTILPIWHNITKQELQDFSQTLVGRKALSTALYTAKEIADELKKIFDKLNADDVEPVSN